MINEIFIINGLSIKATDDESLAGVPISEGMVAMSAMSETRWAKVEVPKAHYKNDEVLSIAEKQLSYLLKKHA